MRHHRAVDSRLLLASAGLSCLAMVAVCACDQDVTLGASAQEDAGSVDAPSDLPDAAESEPLDAGDDAPPFDPSDVPVACAGEPCVLELAAGFDHFCARMSDGRVQCWGANDFGALGTGAPPDDPDPDEASEPTRPSVVTGLTDVVQVSAAGNTTCAARKDRSVRCWGANDHGQLGLEADGGPRSDHDVHAYAMPVALGGASAARVDVGQRSACAVLVSGGLSCWGSNLNSKLARSTSEAVLGPGLADLAGFTVVRTSSSPYSTYALTPAGELLVWGKLAGRYGSLDPDPIPAVIPSLDGVSAVAVGDSHACAIAKGRVHCWGSGLHGALGTGLGGDVVLPTHAAMQTDARAQQLSVSRRTTCVRLTNGTIQCSGEAISGQLGIAPDAGSERIFALRPAELFVDYAVQVMTSDASTCALLRDGTVKCWGSNEHGQLGQGTLDTNPHPTPLTVTFR